MNPASTLEPALLAVRHAADAVELDLRIDEDLAALAGHFPGFPVVPGVCLIDWVVSYSKRYLHVDWGGATRLQIKFHRPVQPGIVVTLALSGLSDGRVRFSYRKGDVVHASGTAGGDA